MNPEQTFVQERRAERVLQIAEDDLRRRMIEESPQIRHDVELMADMIRELVKLEREKRGLDRPRGTINLCANKEKKHHSEPDLTGSGWIAGRYYRAAAWLSGKEKVRVVLLPKAK
jgi:hypothetical protein